MRKRVADQYINSTLKKALVFFFSHFFTGFCMMWGMRFLRMKKPLFFTCILASFLLLFFFQHALICFGVKSFLASRLPKGKQLFFSYETMGWKKGDLLFQGVTLKREAAKKKRGLWRSNWYHYPLFFLGALPSKNNS